MVARRFWRGLLWTAILGQALCVIVTAMKLKGVFREASTPGVQTRQIMKNRSLFITLLLLAGVAFAAGAPENAALPYATLHRLLTVDLKSAAVLTNQEVRLTIRSRNPAVASAEIRLRIESTNGPISVPVATDGTFDLPLSKALLEENPRVVVNQPKGSMQLGGTITLRGASAWAAGNRQRYNSLFFLQDFKKRLAQADFGELKMGDAMDRATVVVRLVPRSDAHNAGVVIASTNGNLALPREADGGFRLRYDPALALENPWVAMSTNCRWKVMTELREEANPAAGGERRVRAEPAAAPMP